MQMPRRQCLKRLPLAALVCGLLVSVAAAAPIDLANRTVPVKVTTSADKGPALNSYEAAFSLTAQQVDAEYGLLVGGSTENPEVYVNGRALEVQPIFRTDGALYLVPSDMLLTGANQVRVTRAAVDAGKSWDGTVMFSVSEAAEQVHFNQIYTDKAIKTAPASDPAQANYDVLYYDCTWEPNMSAQSLTTATVTVCVKALAPLPVLVLDFDNNGGGITVSNISGASSFFFSSGRIYITLPTTVPTGGTATVSIDYSGTPRSTGFNFGPPYVRTTHAGTSLVYTFSEPYGARCWWPCRDLPYDKATTMGIHIVVPTAGAPAGGWQTVSNGKLLSTVTNGGKVTWNWAMDFPISTYLVAFYVTNYKYDTATYTSRDGFSTMQVGHALYNETTGQNGAWQTVEVMNWLADQFGEYPFLSAKYFTAAHSSSSGMEHITCTGMPSTGVLSGGITTARNVHELSHHWFGDKVTCQDFSHLWIQEGVAKYMESLWTEHISGTAAYHSSIDGMTVNTTDPCVGPNADYGTNYFSAVYQKGAYILHMFRHKVGDATFTAFLRAHAQNPATSYGTAVTQDVINVANAVTGQDQTQFFEQYLYRPGSGAPHGGGVFEPYAIPTYQINGTVSGPAGNKTLGLTLDQIQLSGSGTPFQMPIDIEADELNGTSRTLTINNSTLNATYSLNVGTSNPVEIQFDPWNWVLKSMRTYIRTVALPPFLRNHSYYHTLRAGGSGTSFTWAITAGALPAGISMSSAGVISGIPTTNGTGSIVVQVTSNAGVTRSTTLNWAVTDANEIIIESRVATMAGAGNGPSPSYSESGTFSNSASKSAAAGEVGAGSRYSTTVNNTATFSPGISKPGFYSIYVTLDGRDTSPNNNAHASYTINHNGAPISSTVYLSTDTATGGTAGLEDNWLLLASNVLFAEGQSGAAGGITFTNTDGNAASGKRFVMDAVRFVWTGPDNTAVAGWELY
jgi:hypothetical protein